MNSNTQAQTKVFSGQRDGEQFLFMFRKHLLVMRKGLLSFLVIFLLGCLPFLIIQDNSMLWFTLSGVVLGMIVFFYHFVTWYFSLYIVSDQRIRQIIQSGLFYKNVIDLPLEKVQSINYVVPGFWAEIGRFGTVNIQTMVGDLTINNVMDPEKIYNNLQNALNIVENREAQNGEK